MRYFRRSTTIPPLILFLCLVTSINYSLAYDSKSTVITGRSLKSIKETSNGGNATFDCSPSGPCVPCSRGEKSDEKYRCGETGYRIRLKCLPVGSDPKDAKNIKAKKTRFTMENADLGVDQRISSKRQRRLQDDSSRSGGSSGYTTYRSCIPAVSEEKLSVLGFEALMLTLLISSGSFILFRRKHSGAPPGGVYQCGSQLILGFELTPSQLIEISY